MTAYTDLDTTVQTFEEGAFEYLHKPFDIDDALELAARACAHGGGDAHNPAQPPAESGDWQRPLRQWAQQQSEQNAEIKRMLARVGGTPPGRS
jgi:DNA-binding NtrC family response regulator